MPFFIYYFLSKISSTQLIAAIVDGKPIIGKASNTVGQISSLEIPNSIALRV
jgi:hypothetical protein